MAGPARRSTARHSVTAALGGARRSTQTAKEIGNGCCCQSSASEQRLLKIPDLKHLAKMHPQGGKSRQRPDWGSVTLTKAV